VLNEPGFTSGNNGEFQHILIKPYVLKFTVGKYFPIPTRTATISSTFADSNAR